MLCILCIFVFFFVRQDSSAAQGLVGTKIVIGPFNGKTTQISPGSPHTVVNLNDFSMELFVLKGGTFISSSFPNAGFCDSPSGGRREISFVYTIGEKYEKVFKCTDHAIGKSSRKEIKINSVSSYSNGVLLMNGRIEIKDNYKSNGNAYVISSSHTQEIALVISGQSCKINSFTLSGNEVTRPLMMYD